MTSQSDEHRQPVSVAVAVLAAGNSTRMKSEMPKHVHPVGGVPIVKRIIRAAQGINPDHIAVVLSPAMMDLPERLGMVDEFLPVEMEVPTGTAHAVLAAIEAVPQVDYIVSLLGDSALLRAETIQRLLDRAVKEKALVTVLTCNVDDAKKYGRLDRDDAGRPIAIIEEKNDDSNKRKGLTEINSGIMVLQRDWALKAIPQVKIDPGKKEYFLTELVQLAAAEAQPDQTWPVAIEQESLEVSMGIDTRLQQADADDVIRKETRKKHLEAGVTMIGRETIFIDEAVTIGQDTTLLPGTILMGNTTIGTGCTIGPYAVLTDATVGDNVTVRNSTVESSTIRSNTDIGPYAHIRGESHIGENVHIGSYAELKNAKLDAGVKSGHFSYLGDVHIGENTNIGAGTITANFDGVNKNHTEIGRDVFIGSDTILVAPVEVEEGARTGAGSVVTKPVKSGQTVVGIPARPIVSRSARDKE